MDGYAVRNADIHEGAVLRVIGSAQAGRRGTNALGPGEAMRIFTGAPVPDGADRVVIQEDVTASGDQITIAENADPGPYIRPIGADFTIGDQIEAPRRLDPQTILLAAAMNLPTLPCARQPVVSIIATGDELVMPGGAPGPDQIMASNGLGLKALLEREGAIVRLLPIARDRKEALHSVIDLAGGSDLIVTIGGASVGDHDLVQHVAGERGMTPSFYKVAMRPGKPLMAGRLDGIPMIGLPGNPTSAMVCGMVFVVPALRAMQGAAPAPAPRLTGTLAAPIAANGPREHYMRATLSPEGLRLLPRQDSGLMSVLTRAQALIVRPPNDPARDAGTQVDYLPL
jgi:molybdopterin molybdotransferase